MRRANFDRQPMSRFSGARLSDLFGIEVDGSFDDDYWALANHQDLSGGTGLSGVHFGGAPSGVRNALKEFLLLAVRPHVHAVPTCPSLIGVEPKKITTVVRGLSGLAVDLQWLIERSHDHTLANVTNEDLDALVANRDLDYRRTAALKSFGRYCAAMSPTLDRLTIEPWPGRSGLDVAGRSEDKDEGNSTPLFDTGQMLPWLETAMLLIENGKLVVDVATRSGPTAALIDGANGTRVRLVAEGDSRYDRYKMLKYVAAACVFATAAFTGMRASELDAVPRDESLTSIEIRGARRWLLTSYLVKGLPQPRRETWLVPPIVRDAVVVMRHVLERRGIAADAIFPPTGETPLFDRRALSMFDDETGSKSVLRLSRAIDTLAEAIDHLQRLGLVSPRTGKNPTGRQLRRNLTIAVASRPHGAQAAMEQFKWQRAETAAGYFRVAPDGVALGQREVYEEVAAVHRELVVDALHDEFLVWERQVEAEGSADLPAGADGRRKRDMFAAVRNQMPARPRVEEDNRRLRRLLKEHAATVHLTEFGWCDWDEQHARCGGIGGPAPAMCEPDACLNHSTPSTAVAAHQVRWDRLTSIGKDPTFPALARDKAKASAEGVAAHIGRHLRMEQ